MRRLRVVPATTVHGLELAGHPVENGGVEHPILNEVRKRLRAAVHRRTVTRDLSQLMMVESGLRENLEFPGPDRAECQLSLRG
jgi:hypothetical protein